MKFSEFRLRHFVAFMMLAGFLVMALSGAVVFLAPSWLLAKQSGWKFLAFGKDEWVSLHITFGAAFIIFGAMHVCLNYRPIFSYLREKAGKVSECPICAKLRPEFIAAVVLSAFLFLSVIYGFPPANLLSGIHESISNYWQEALLPKQNSTR